MCKYMSIIWRIIGKKKKENFQKAYNRKVLEHDRLKPTHMSICIVVTVKLFIG